MSRNPIRKQCCRWLCVCVWMLIIFMFSAENATESTATSSTTLQFLLHFFRIEDSVTATSNLHFWLRKSAHFGVYTILGILLLGAVRQQWQTLAAWRQSVLAVCMGSLYAMSDEIHQYFVPGRACQFRDVCIDTCGVCFGVLLWLVFQRLCAFLAAKKKQRHTHPAPSSPVPSVPPDGK